MQLLSDKLWFPAIRDDNDTGIVAVGGDLKPERLLLAYRSGIFPWYEEGQPILWWCPDPRMVLFPSELKISKNLRKLLDKNKFDLTFNRRFADVIDHCAGIKRPGQSGTWITEAMIESYNNLHLQGMATSVEVWEEDKLVGGLYGVDLAEIGVFCGESMFSLVSNASKVALCALVEELRKKDYKLIDCQVYTDHLASLGGREISRKDFMGYLKTKD